MIIKKLNVYFFIFLLIAVTSASVLLIKPYVTAIFLAAVFVIIFNRPYEIVQKTVRSKVLASFIMLLVVAVTMILPVVIVMGVLYDETSRIVTDVMQPQSHAQEIVTNAFNATIDLPIMHGVVEKINHSIANLDVQSVMKNVANHSVSFFHSAYKGIVSGVVGLFVMFFAMFYFFIDGKKIVRKMMDLSPLPDKHEKKLIREFISMVRATLKGTVAIGFIQGSIGGLAFWVTGVVSPFVWTVVMIVLAIIPAVGASLVIFPAAIIMAILGYWWQAIVLFIVGWFVSVIDNILRPKFVGNDTQMHPLAVFFATLGGLKLFGLIGFITGPIIMALMLAMWKIYEYEFKDQLKVFNK